jgi:hypothetical protein
MKSMMIVHGPRASGKTFTAQALAAHNKANGQEVVVYEVSTLKEVKRALPNVPDSAMAIFVCDPNFVFDPKDLRPALSGNVLTYKVYVNRFTDLA